MRAPSPQPVLSPSLDTSESLLLLSLELDPEPRFLNDSLVGTESSGETVDWVRTLLGELMARRRIALASYAAAKGSQAMVLRSLFGRGGDGFDGVAKMEGTARATAETEGTAARRETSPDRSPAAPLLSLSAMPRGQNSGKCTAAAVRRWP